MSTSRVRGTLALAVVVTLSLAAVTSRGAGGAEVYALVGGRVITVAGSVLEEGTVVLRDGLIEGVGSALRPPADARVIDVKGLTLTPGIIDAFGGVGLPAPPPTRASSEGSGPAAPAAGATPLAPQAFVLDRIRAADALKARDAGVTTALVVPREGVLPGRSVLINLSGDRPEGMVLLQPAAMHLHMATLAGRYPGSLMGTVAYARQALLDAAHYRASTAAYEKAPRGHKRPRYDSALAAWQDVLAGKQVLVVTATRENDIRRALALADEFKVKVAIAGAMQAQLVADMIKARRVPLLVSVNYDPPRPATFFGGADEDKERRDIEEAEKNPAALHRAGVAFALVSGHAPDFLAGVRKAVERGLPREAALRAITLSSAEALGVSDRLGSLEAGKIANVVAWSGEPLTKDAKPKLVFVDGEMYEPDEKASPSPSPAPSPSPVPSLVPSPVTSPSPVPSPSPTPTPTPEVLR
jgi:imidazolonepropionase-like amidohydrolase